MQIVCHQVELVGTSSLERGLDLLQSLPSCQCPLPPRQQPVPRLPRRRLLPRHRRRLLRALHVVLTATLRLSGRRLLADHSRQQQLRAGAGGRVHQRRARLLAAAFRLVLQREILRYNVEFSGASWAWALWFFAAALDSRRDEDEQVRAACPTPLPACLCLPYVSPTVPCAPCGGSVCALYGTMHNACIWPPPIGCAAASCDLRGRIWQLVCLIARCFAARAVRSLATLCAVVVSVV
jgi:hypothetical protein